MGGLAVEIYAFPNDAALIRSQSMGSRDFLGMILQDRLRFDCRHFPSPHTHLRHVLPLLCPRVKPAWRQFYPARCLWRNSSVFLSRLCLYGAGLWPVVTPWKKGT